MALAKFLMSSEVKQVLPAITRRAGEAGQRPRRYFPGRRGSGKCRTLVLANEIGAQLQLADRTCACAGTRIFQLPSIAYFWETQ
jgi:hypothetical protein